MEFLLYSFHHIIEIFFAAYSILLCISGSLELRLQYLNILLIKPAVILSMVQFLSYLQIVLLMILYYIVAIHFCHCVYQGPESSWIIRMFLFIRLINMLSTLSSALFILRPKLGIMLTLCSFHTGFWLHFSKLRLRALRSIHLVFFVHLYLLLSKFMPIFPVPAGF